MHGAIWDSRRLRVARRPRRPESIEPHVVRWAAPSQKTAAQVCPRQTCPPLRKLHYSKILISILKNLASLNLPISSGRTHRTVACPSLKLLGDVCEFRFTPMFPSTDPSAFWMRKYSLSRRQAGRKLKKMIQYKIRPGGGKQLHKR